MKYQFAFPFLHTAQSISKPSFSRYFEDQFQSRPHNSKAQNKTTTWNPTERVVSKKPGWLKAADGAEVQYGFYGGFYITFKE